MEVSFLRAKLLPFTGDVSNDMPRLTEPKPEQGDSEFS